MAVVLAWILSNIPGKQDQTYAEKRCTEQHLRYSEVESVIGVQGEETSSPDQSTSQNKYEQNTETKWCDLAAQQSMANSTRWAVYAAWVSALVTIAGVILVAMTLHYTANTLDEAKTATNVAQIGAEEARKTNEITRQQLIASQRPWIKVTAKINSGLWHTETEVRLKILFTVQNIGNHPASDIWIDATLARLEYEFTPIQSRLDEMIAEALSRPRVPFASFLFPTEVFTAEHEIGVSKQDLPEEFGGMLQIQMLCCVSYMSGTSPTRHRTILARDIKRYEPLDPGKPPYGGMRFIRVSDDNIPIENLRMSKSVVVPDYAD